ncbi:MAG: hypothetical protein HKO92_06650 [Flavobacteriaceae bacterium]|nr:hypothetical protein [Flavobacteriaceae bacterium]
MKFSLGKIKSAFGKNDEKKAIKDAEFIQELKTSIKDKPFSTSEQNILFAGMNELAGYFYFKVIVIGRFKIKTFNGVKLFLKLNNAEMELNSDMNELASDFGPIPNSYVTAVDFELSKKQIEKLNNSKIESLKIVCKKKEVVFTKSEH